MGMSGVSLARRAPSAALLGFAEEIGSSDAVRVVGGRTQWERGRAMVSAARELHAPTGIVSLEPAELIVRVTAGTTWGELDAALRDANMMCPIDAADPAATIGGTLSVGESGFRRLRYGHIRDLLLEAHYVSAAGQIVKAGAPVVKNVTGYDLCRLLVGSIGTLGLIGEVVLRCGPRPAAQQWMHSALVDPFAVRGALYQPSCIAWNGRETYVCIEGSATDVHSDISTLSKLVNDWTETAPPSFPRGHRVSKRPSALRMAPRDFGKMDWLAEIGVGLVHVGGADTMHRSCNEGSVRNLNVETKHAFDPQGRLNPGVQP
jgi:hypothetical protein